MNTDPAAPSDAVLDAVADAITDDLSSPSAIAKRAKVTTTEAHFALRWLRSNRMVIATGNGSWTKYRTRSFGERI